MCSKIYFGALSGRKTAHPRGEPEGMLFLEGAIASRIALPVRSAPGLHGARLEQGGTAGLPVPAGATPASKDNKT